MQRFILILLTLAIGLSLSFDADARRFGGGRSFGAAPMHQPRQSAPSTPSVAPAAPGRAMPGAGASRWLGPLAGLAAGGLLASLFMGGGFQGIQMFDVLIVALLGFIAFRFFVARRGAAPLQPVSGGGGAFQRQPLEQVGRDPVFGSASSPVPRAVINAPAWFNEQRFVEAARGHFQALQQHWDANEMDKIAAFVTPQMLQFLKQGKGGG